MDQGMNRQCGKDCSCARCCSSFFSWKAVFAGAFVGIGLAFLLNLFSVAIGLSAFTADSVAGMETLAIGGFLGIVIGTVVSMFLAGWVAGYLGRPYCVRRNSGSLYGFVTWTLILLITAMFAGQTGRYVTVYTDFVSHPAVMGSDRAPRASVAMTAHETKANAKATATATAATNAAAQQVVSGIALSAFVVFALFLAGAFASAFGGHCGMTKRECDTKCG